MNDWNEVLGWNEAMETAAALFRRGFTFVRRLVGDDMAQTIEVHPGDADVDGEYDEACHSTPSDMDVAAIFSLMRPPGAPLEKTWRCFHCDETFTAVREAAEHFGVDQGIETACRIKAHEGHLVHRIRDLEDQLARYRAEDSDVMRSIMTLEADHRRALISVEEQGYARGLRDAEQANVAELCTDGPPGERRRFWLLKFDDPDKGYGLYENKNEAMRAWDRAKDNWTCTLFVTAEFVQPEHASQRQGPGALLHD